MARITIDGQAFECREGTSVLQVALEAGFDVPHYCYHPALSIVGSCRLCMMEMQLPDPRTGEMGWAPKLFPSCQTPAKDGMVVRFDSEKVRANQKHCMEFLLLNHPLDCPVCDQAGECYLQDYSYRFGSATSRMVDAKTVNPKKNIGPRTMLYQDRCILCKRCLRFAKEVTGTSELCVVNRGHRAEIDVFPGVPLDNPLQGNVVDLCPVGALLDKDFLFKQRVWYLEGGESICPGCSTGCAIRVDSSENRVCRIKGRYNPGVNDWWICDEGRFGWKYVQAENRIVRPVQRRSASAEPLRWEDLSAVVTYQIKQQVEKHGGGKVACVLSPMMACEEAWLLARFIRTLAPEASLAAGPVVSEGTDQSFPVGCGPAEAKFTIRAERCPNARGVQAIRDAFGGPSCTFEEFVAGCESGSFTTAWVVGGYPKDWADKAAVKALSGVVLLVVQDILPNGLTEAANVLLPHCAWTERSGSFMNHSGLIQPFERAVNPPDGAKRDGQYLFELAGFPGLYSGEHVRAVMAEEMAAFAEISEAPVRPVHQH